MRAWGAALAAALAAHTGTATGIPTGTCATGTGADGSNPCTGVPPMTLGAQLIIHFHRESGDYADWGLHMWGDAILTGPIDWAVPWGSSATPPMDSFGAVYTVPVIHNATSAQPVNYILHKGDTKSVTTDETIDITRTMEVWLFDGDATQHMQNPQVMTFHFRIPDGDYAGWGMHSWGLYNGPPIDWAVPVAPIGFDRFGAVFQLPTSAVEGSFPFIFHKGDVKSVDEDQSWEVGNGMEIWITQGSADALTHCPTRVRFHFKLPSGDYTGWGMHTWGDALDTAFIDSLDPPLGWADPIPAVGRDQHGGVWDLWLADAALPVNFIFHLGDVKSVSEDQTWDPAGGLEVWLTRGSTDIFPYDPVVGPKVVYTGPPIEVILHYHHPEGEWDGWGVDVRGLAVPSANRTSWTEPRGWDGEDSFGRFARIVCPSPDRTLTLKIHRFDWEFAGMGAVVNIVPLDTAEVWVRFEDKEVYTAAPAIDAAYTAMVENTYFAVGGTLTASGDWIGDPAMFVLPKAADMRTRLVRYSFDHVVHLRELRRDIARGSRLWDIAELSIVDTADMSEDLADLRPEVDASFFRDHLFSALLPQYELADGKIAGVPLWIEPGLLYYRKDLFAKYGFSTPPSTWRTLHHMAQVIVRGEKEALGNDTVLHGLIFEGTHGSGLTLVAMEWAASSGAGLFIQDDGTVVADSAAMVEAMHEFRSITRDITPPAALEWDVKQVASEWSAGHAVFCRQTPDMVKGASAALRTADGEPTFGIARMPGGMLGMSASVFDATGISVNALSRHVEMGRRVARHMVEEAAQKTLQAHQMDYPARPDLLIDADACSWNKFKQKLCELPHNLRARPAAATRMRFLSASDLISTAVSSIMHAAEGGAVSGILGDLQRDLERLLYDPTVTLEPVLLPSPPSDGLPLWVVIVIVVGVLAIVGIPLSIRLTAEKRRTMRLYNINRVAEESAHSIATMQLDEMDWLFQLPNPTKLQFAFMSIIKTLKQYRHYMPASLLVGDDEEDDVDEDKKDNTPKSKDGKSGQSGATVSKRTGTKMSSHHASQSMRRAEIERAANAKTAMAITKKKASQLSLNVNNFSQYAKAHHKVVLSEHSQFLQQLVTITSKNKGLADGFQADRYYASFGGARPNGSHATCSALCALDLSGAGKGVTSGAGTPSVLCGPYSIGVAGGECLAGNMGCDGLRKFTIIGRAASMVHVIEQQNARYCTEVLISAGLQRDVVTKIESRMIMKVCYKGDEYVLHEARDVKKAGEDEWMYQVDQGEKNDPNLVWNQAMTVYWSGKCEEGMDILKKDPVSSDLHKTMLAEMEAGEAKVHIVGASLLQMQFKSLV